MKCSIFIATSVDGFIAELDGSVGWLHSAGNQDVDMGNQADMGMGKFMSTIDCLIMGRKSMETIAKMDLTPEQWPYGTTRIIVLSNTIKVPPVSMMGRVEIYSGPIPSLIAKLEEEGYKHAYIDGGTTIQSFLNLKLIEEMIITKAPVLLGEGIPLFGKTDNNIKLEQAEAVVFPNDFIQVKYKLSYQS